MGIGCLARSFRNAFPVALLAITVLAPLASIRADDAAWAYTLRQAVETAREGHLEQGLDALAALSRRFPGEPRIENDYAVVATWAGDDRLAHVILRNRPLNELPVYVLSAYAKSLRNLKLWPEARLAYDHWLRQEPASITARIGLVLTEVDAQDYAAAEARLADIRPREMSPEQLPAYYLACGYIQERQQKLIQALDCYNIGLRSATGNRALLERRAFVASALGAPGMAERDLALLTPGVPETEHNQVRLNSDAQQVRWLHAEQGTERERSADAVLTAYGTLNRLTPPQELTRRYDALVALVAGQRMQEALTSYRALRAEAGGLEKLPSYVLSAAGQALLHLERPDEAVDVYSAALANLPENAPANARFDLEVSRFAALFDAGRYMEAYDLGQQLAGTQQPWIRPKPRLWLENDRFVTARETSALADAYTERYDAALDALEEMLSIAPANHDLRLSSAIIERWRGRPRRSAAEAQLVQDDRYAYPRTVLEGQIALDVGDYATAQRTLDTARQLDPRGKPTHDLERRLDIARRPEVSVVAGFARSDGPQQGNNSFTIDTTAHGGVLFNHYRPFATSHYAQADFDEGKGRDHRIGAGVEYIRPFWTLSAMAHKGIEQNRDVGFTLEHQWHSIDSLFHDTVLSSNSFDVPLRGQRVGVTADEIRHATRWRWNDGSSVTGSLGFMDFDDGNERTHASLYASQRFYNKPFHKLYALGSLYRSDNTLDDASYFNPDNDFDARVGLRHEWRLQHDYNTSRTLQSEFWWGYYDQQGFGGDGLWEVSVEYAQALNDVLEFTFGVSTGRHPYDGRQERSDEVRMSLRARP
ncbi:MAG: poly-beta-1,6 N-acetyl-D-glucosamine export porin PgaA [Pseudomonadales bacterium]|nr:poly-beta-1,6 N-acetyl-D-glucosamine export porin PgaA [Pseudomonadales bacterium]